VPQDGATPEHLGWGADRAAADAPAPHSPRALRQVWVGQMTLALQILKVSWGERA